MAAKILLQLDTDQMASTFDAVVAIDAGVDHLLRHSGVTPDNVTPLVHGAMFTRGGDGLRDTAIFVGGSDVSAAEQVAAKIESCFFGPVRVSLLQDASGCNTTAAAAVLCAAKHVAYRNATVCVLGGTGPVGKRVAEMIALEGGSVRLVSRSIDRATAAATAIAKRVQGSVIEPFQATTPEETARSLGGSEVVIACGAAGVQLLDAKTLAAADSVRAAIDLNAVPPAGIEGVEATEKAKERGGVICYGALGAGGLKMKIHRAAIKALFDRNDAVLDAREVLAIGKGL
ncbi:MAG: NAD(P)-dependent methylenetetrahydromethanopterin dehydrogenase [Planctomycetaceae bacterium]